jgi:outer membrane protein TolC
MKNWITISAVALASILAGCVDEKKEVDQYRHVLDGPSTIPATAHTDKLPATLTLQDAMKMANDRNEQLAISGENYLQALIDRDRAVTAFLPTVSLAPSYYRMDPVPLPEAAAAFFPLHATDVPVTGGMNVFNGFRDVAALKQAASNIEQRKALLKDLQCTLLVEVSQVYYQVLRSEKVFEVLTNSVKVQEDRVRYLQSQFRAGVARRMDLEQAKAQAAATRVSLVRAQSDVVRGRATLAFLIGAAEVNCPLADQFHVPPVAPLESLQKQAAADRQDLAAAIAGIGAAKQGLQQAIGQYYPSVSVNVELFLRRQTFPKDSEWEYMFSANLPIFSGTRIHSDVRAALSRLRQAKLNESLVRRQIVENVRIAYENLSASQKAMVELRTEQTAAEEGYRQASNSFKAGTGTNLEVLIAQDQLLRAQVELASQDFERKVAYLTLIRVVGGQLLVVRP